MRLFFAILAFACALAPSVKSQELLVLTEEFKPYQYKNDQGRPTGFMVEFIETVFERAGIGMEGGGVKIDIWAKDYETLLGTDNAAAFMTVRTTDRETLPKWVGPLAPRDTWLYKLDARDDIRVETLDDAKTYRIGAYQSAQSDYLKEFGFPHLDVARLLSGEVDMVPSLEPMMSQRLKDLGKRSDEVEKVILLDGRFDYYLALNPQVSDDVVDRLQSALDAAKADGRTYARLEAKYIN